MNWDVPKVTPLRRICTCGIVGRNLRDVVYKGPVHGLPTSCIPLWRSPDAGLKTSRISDQTQEDATSRMSCHRRSTYPYPPLTTRTSVQTRRDEMDRQGSHPVSKKPVHGNDHSAPGPPPPNAWKGGGPSGYRDANCQRGRAGHPDTLFTNRSLYIVTGTSVM